MRLHKAATSLFAMFVFALCALAPSASAATVTPLIITPERLAALPTTGTPYTYMKARADAAMTYMKLTMPADGTSPILTNFNGSGNVTRPGVQTLAAALVYARTKDVRYRDFVIRSNRFLIGTETIPSNTGTPAYDIVLATVRNITAYVLAADLVGMDPNVTGSRAGYTGTGWRTWLSALRTNVMTNSSNCPSLMRCANERAHNWGAFASAARVAIDLYLDDQADLAVAVSRLKRWLGESLLGLQWWPSYDFDITYACVPAGLTWTALNGTACGAKKDGMIVEDISRSAGAYPIYDSKGIAYIMESFQAQLVAAILLERRAYLVFQWGNQGFRRIMDWLVREGKPFGNGSSIDTHQSWIPRYFYKKTYPTMTAGMGRTFGFTDWLYG